MTKPAGVAVGGSMVHSSADRSQPMMQQTFEFLIRFVGNTDTETLILLSDIDTEHTRT